MNEPIQTLLNKSILSEEDQFHDPVYRSHWRVSNAGRCYRYQYWYRKGKTMSNPVDLRVLSIFRVGDLFHRDLQSLLPESHVEVYLIEGDRTGHVDRLEPKFVEDFKTVNSNQWGYISKDNYDVEKDKLQYCFQLMTYVEWCGKKAGVLTFINKDTYEMRSFEIPLTDQWKTRVREEYAVLRKYWATQKTPPALPRCYGFKECNYCGYKDTCDKIDKSTAKERMEKAKKEDSNGK